MPEINHQSKLDKFQFFLASFNVFILNSINYIYRPLESINRLDSEKESIFLYLLHKLTGIINNLNLGTGRSFNRYWNTLKEEFNIQNITTAIEEMSQNVLFIALDELDSSFKGKYLHIKEKLRNSVQQLIHEKKIDENVFNTAIKKYQNTHYAFVILTLQAQQKAKPLDDLRNFLQNELGFLNMINNAYIFYKELSAAESYQAIQNEFDHIKSLIENAEIINEWNQKAMKYMIHVLFVHPNNIIQYKIGRASCRERV